MERRARMIDDYQKMAAAVGDRPSMATSKRDTHRRALSRSVGRTARGLRCALLR
jgi:hypothetical protein